MTSVLECENLYAVVLSVFVGKTGRARHRALINRKKHRRPTDVASSDAKRSPLRKHGGEPITETVILHCKTLLSTFAISRAFRFLFLYF